MQQGMVERIRSRGLSSTGGGARLRGRWVIRLQAGRQAGIRNGRCSRAKARLELGFIKARRRGRDAKLMRLCALLTRVIRPTRAKTRRLRVSGDHGPLAQTNPRRPAGQVMAMDRQPGAVVQTLWRSQNPVPASPHRRSVSSYFTPSGLVWNCLGRHRRARFHPVGNGRSTSRMLPHRTS